ncbi:hypothetical protein [Sphingomonas abaci]|jgi:hypothetical protein|uniref:Uncharacterized protein n=1 Tax=Sphingomonas abaci TaxID=237611 RepID=A0A7W7AP32_9SPHN|nr:hypothetical protein [Sphingomonas abaci]MBB4619664.1 hypothetical protein [Sphingomonas abaci]
MADFNDGFLNPATGLPMVNGLDTGGNIAGSDGNRWLDDADDAPSLGSLTLAQKLFAGSFAAIVLGTIAGGVITKAF